MYRNTNLEGLSCFAVEIESVALLGLKERCLQSKENFVRHLKNCMVKYEMLFIHHYWVTKTINIFEKLSAVFFEAKT